MSYPITIKKTTQSKHSDEVMQNVDFGKVFSDHMLVADYNENGWQGIHIVPYQEISLSPAVSAIHYGQSVFEGMKAYADKDGHPLLFRPAENWKRMNRSAERMCMPEVPKEIFLDGLRELIQIDKHWVPRNEGSSLYIRPFMFATDDFIGIRPSQNYRFMIFCCPVNAYYPEPIRVKIETEYSRACQGGGGYAKAAGNYGQALYPAHLAQKEGYRQLIWTDACDHKYIEESGTMNIFFQIGNSIVTPEAGGTILEGITRDSAIALMKDHGIDVQIRNVSVDEITAAYNQGELLDAFGTGTAATIAQISAIGYNDHDMILRDAKTREISNWLLKTLEEIKRGTAEDKWGWIEPV
ncbi:MAG: branched-chain amino acid aminotransferase [Bacteroidia bacterium]